MVIMIFVSKVASGISEAAFSFKDKDVSFIQLMSLIILKRGGQKDGEKNTRIVWEPCFQ